MLPKLGTFLPLFLGGLLSWSSATPVAIEYKQISQEAAAHIIHPPTPTPTATPIPTETPTPMPTPTPTPSPIPSPTPTKVPQGDIQGWIDTYSKHYSIDRDMLARIANCESKFNTNAKNGIYEGMFQFAPGTWRAARQRMNQNPDETLRTHAEEAIKTAAFVISTQGTRAWLNCSK